MAIKKIYFSLILPVFNEGSSFEASIKNIYKILGKLKKTYEVIFVEDKSTDGSIEILKKISHKLPNTKVIFHSKNQGRGKSVSDGLYAAKGKYAGFLDVDLEVSADYILLFIKELEKGFDLIVGKRFYEKNLTAVTRVASSVGYKLIVHSLLHLPIDDTEAGYKFFRRDKILPVLSKTTEKGWFWDTEICARSYWAGLKITQVPVLFIRRLDKASTVRLIPDTLSYLKNIYRFRTQIPKKFSN